MVQGTPGRISVFDKKNLDLLNTFQFPGADVPESKSTVQLVYGKAFVAAGTALGSVPRPIVPGLDPSVVVTNAVSADRDLVFISNGEAGVYVTQSPKRFNQFDAEEPIEFALLGRLGFQDLQSVNHIEYKQDVLFVAAGRGGLKIVKVDGSNSG